MDKSRMLAIEINKAIDEIDIEMDYDEFAQAVALILREEYGKRSEISFIHKLIKYIVYS